MLPPPSLRRRAFALAQLAMGALVAAGSSFEVLNLIFPSLLPEIQDVPLMRLHHSNPVVFYWTLCSNLVTAVLGALLVRAALGTFRGSVTASLTARRIVALFAIIVVGATTVSGIYLLPHIQAMLHSPPDHTMGVVLLVSVVSSLAGLAFMLTLLHVAHGIILAKSGAPAA